MRVVVFISFFLTFYITNGQVSLCGSKTPFPDKILTIQEEIEFKNKMDSLRIKDAQSSKGILKKSHRTTYGKPLDSIYYFWGELKKLQTEIIKLSRDTLIDTSSKYKLLFIEDYGWRVEWNNNIYNSYDISQFNLVINCSEFFKKENIVLNYIFNNSYSYNKQYLIVEECHQYTGNTSWFNRKVHYFEKVKD